MFSVLRILSTTDLHGQIWPHDYTRDEPEPLVGLATASQVISHARGEVKNSILVDNGDILQGSALVDPEILGAQNGRSLPNPAIATMNALDYDVATLGNHDFNFGLDHLRAALTDARFPHVLANIVRRRGASPLEDEPLLPPYVIIEREMESQNGVSHTIRIGVIGLAPPQITHWDRHLLNGSLETRGMVEAARFWTPAMRKAGADIIIGLCHTGPGAQGAPDDAEDAGLEVAAQGDFDALILGHNHRRLPGNDFSETPGVDAIAGRVAGKPAVMAGSAGRFIGVIDLDLVHNGIGWSVAGASCELRPQSTGLEAPPHLNAISSDAHNATLKEINQSCGTTKTAIQSYFPSVLPDSSLQLVSDAQFWRARQLLAELEAPDTPLLSAVAPFRAGGRGGPQDFTRIDAGPVRIRHLSGLAPFPNPVCVVEASGAQLRRWLERASSLYAQIDPGSEDRDLFAPGFAIYNLDSLFGLEYSIDLSRPAMFEVGGSRRPLAEAGGRIGEMRYLGEPVAETQRFFVATSSYRAAGGGGFSMVAECPVVATAPENLRRTLADYVGSHSPIDPQTAQPWRFAPIGASAVFDSHPDAAPVETANPLPRIERLSGLTKNGFGKFRVRL